MARPRRLSPRDVADLDQGPSWELADTNVTHQGHALALFVAPSDIPAVTGQAASDTKTRAAYTALIVEHDGQDIVTRTTLRGLSVAHPKVGTLPTGETIVVGSRCRVREHNASVHDPDGDQCHSFCAGDGIEHLRVDRTGAIWLAYFDEGVYGNLGWSHPLGHSGLRSVDVRGGETWAFASGEPIDDCYALNVFGDQVWCCYYSDFPVVQVAGGVVTSWANSVAGVFALAVDADQVTLVGTYDVPEQVTVGTLSSGHLSTTAPYRLRRRPARIVGCGPVIHIFDGTRWSQLDDM